MLRWCCPARQGGSASPQLHNKGPTSHQPTSHPNHLFLAPHTSAPQHFAPRSLLLLPLPAPSPCSCPYPCPCPNPFIAHALCSLILTPPPSTTCPGPCSLPTIFCSPPLSTLVLTQTSSTPDPGDRPRSLQPGTCHGLIVSAPPRCTCRTTQQGRRIVDRSRHCKTAILTHRGSLRVGPESVG